MQRDRYDNAIDTASATARDHYIAGMDAFLAGQHDMIDKLEAAVAEDPGSAICATALARVKMVRGDAPGAGAAMASARAAASALDDRQASHVHAMGLLVDGRVPDAYRAMRAHTDAYPRDVLIAQPSTSIFGLIGLSGRPGREAEMLAYTEALSPHYGDDWWCQSMHAFSLCEVGKLDDADTVVDRALASNPHSAHSAHVRSHIYYEAGDTSAGVDYLDTWIADYDRRGIMHGHLSWHTALWSLHAGDTVRVWSTVDRELAPDVCLAPPLNILTDNVSILFRALMAGEDVPIARWQTMSDYALARFPKPGLAFADMHAALAHAMAGASEALDGMIAAPAGPAAPMVRSVAKAFRAIAAGAWTQAISDLSDVMSDHARIGGSRAQRDMVDLALVYALVKAGHVDEARRTLTMRRPIHDDTPPVAGL